MRQTLRSFLPDSRLKGRLRHRGFRTLLGLSLGIFFLVSVTTGLSAQVAEAEALNPSQKGVVIALVLLLGIPSMIWGFYARQKWYDYLLKKPPLKRLYPMGLLFAFGLLNAYLGTPAAEWDLSKIILLAVVMIVVAICTVLL